MEQEEEDARHPPHEPLETKLHVAVLSEPDESRKTILSTLLSISQQALKYCSRWNPANPQATPPWVVKHQAWCERLHQTTRVSYEGLSHPGFYLGHMQRAVEICKVCFLYEIRRASANSTFPVRRESSCVSFFVSIDDVSDISAFCAARSRAAPSPSSSPAPRTRPKRLHARRSRAQRTGAARPRPSAGCASRAHPPANSRPSPHGGCDPRRPQQPPACGNAGSAEGDVRKSGAPKSGVPPEAAGGCGCRRRSPRTCTWSTACASSRRGR